MTERRTYETETVIYDVDRPDPMLPDPTKRAPGEPDEMVGGAAVGGLAGAIAGAAVGGPVGAVIGGAIGAATGTTVGAVDESNKANTR